MNLLNMQLDNFSIHQIAYFGSSIFAIGTFCKLLIAFFHIDLQRVFATYAICKKSFFAKSKKFVYLFKMCFYE